MANASVSVLTAYIREKPGGGALPYMGAIRGCAAQQGMVFASLSLEQGIQITVSVWDRGIFYVQFGSGTGSIFPQNPRLFTIKSTAATLSTTEQLFVTQSQARLCKQA